MAHDSTDPRSDLACALRATGVLKGDEDIHLADVMLDLGHTDVSVENLESAREYAHDGLVGDDRYYDLQLWDAIHGADRLIAHLLPAS